MRHVIETGTDAATLCFFDPVALPSEFDERVKGDEVSTFEQLKKQGCLWWKSTGGDGAYLFHFYIDSDVPAQILKYSQDSEEIFRFGVPSGKIWACGAEYAGRKPEEQLAKFSHMGGSFNTSPGEYAVKIWRTEWPNKFIEQEIKRVGGKSMIRTQNTIGPITGILFVGLLLTTFGAGALSLSRSVRCCFWFWAVIGSLWVVCFALMALLLRMERNPAKQQAEREFPSIVVQMNRLTE